MLAPQPRRHVLLQLACAGKTLRRGRIGDEFAAIVRQIALLSQCVEDDHLRLGKPHREGSVCKAVW